MWAAKNGHVKVIEILIAGGADVTLRDISGIFFFLVFILCINLLFLLLTDYYFDFIINFTFFSD